MNDASRFIVGIDLGTTTTEVSYLDTAGDRRVRQFAIPQLISAGEQAARDLLPSFCYFPGEHELPDGALALPWDAAASYAVGEFARDQGAAVPGRLVSSAKSWLAHGGVDRTSGILPWHGDLGSAAVSPVTVSRYYLEHIRNAWDRKFGHQLDADGSPCILREQQVILTVPASFDEAARELTVAAARAAGLDNLVLLEEPLAAFYAWLYRHEADWKEQFQENDRVLVVDIGGGTTDFSLIQVEAGYSLRRTAVGEHLLLGGDNIDMAIGRLAEQHWNLQLTPRQWSMLCQECRRAKERLLQPEPPVQVTITVTGIGSALIGGGRSWQLDAVTLDNLLAEGFFPQIAATGPGPVKRGGIREMGLPYVADPAVTQHLLGFLRQAAGYAAGDTQAKPTVPERILFNGGSLVPARLRQRLCSTVGSWAAVPQSVPELQAEDLHLAVSRGAAYYGAVRRGDGVRVKGGIARSYYLEVAAGEAKSQLVCVMPRDTPEGAEVELAETSYMVVANQPVRFPLYASATRLDDRAGDVLPVPPGDDVTELPPLQTVISYGKGSQRQVEVGLAAVLNEVGTLDIWCDTRDGHHRYPLRFDLRVPVGTAEAAASAPPERLLPAETVSAACSCLAKTFADASLLPGVMRELEQTLGVPRDQWGSMVLRSLADVLLETPAWRSRSAEHETRWWNLLGFCMRPGFGAPTDDWRIRQLWKLWHTGVQHQKPQVVAQWWIGWRRVSAGLRTGQQQQIGNALLRELLPKQQRLGPRKANGQEAVEMWRCIGALERLPVTEKLRLLTAMLNSENRLESHHYWVMARLGSRVLFHGPANAVIPAAELEPLLPALFKLLKTSAPSRMQLLTVARLCRLSGIRALDLSAPLRATAQALLAKHQAPELWQHQLETVEADTLEQQAEMVGDSLPLGLIRDAGALLEAEPS